MRIWWVWLLCATAMFAAAFPALLPYGQPPLATVWQQCLAIAGWGVFVAMLALRPGQVGAYRAAWPPLLALALLLLAALGSWRMGSLPLSAMAQSVCVLAAAIVVLSAGVTLATHPDAPLAWATVCAAWFTAGVLNAAIALLQVFAPSWVDGQWIAHSGLPGRAVGHLGQPNLLCTQLLWGLVAAVALHELKRLPRLLLWGAVALMVLAVVLSASRGGALGLLLLPLWAWRDARLSRTARATLAAAPAVYALFWMTTGMLGWAGGLLVAGGARAAAEAAVGQTRNSRWNLWGDALRMIADQPWQGVGWGEFNFAWTLTPFTGRPTALFDNAHNLPLHLAVELGLPLAAAVLVLLGIGFWRCTRIAGVTEQAQGIVARSALMLVAVVGLHSLSEYPLWYAHFLLPTVFALGLAVGGPSTPTTTSVASGPRVGLLMPAALLVAGGISALVDYQRAAGLYAPPSPRSPVELRIARGVGSLWFGQVADYALATTPGMSEGGAELAFASAPHRVLDAKLMMAWARYLAANGHTELAGALADRLREFDSADAEAFFGECATPGVTAFQCRPAARAPGWRSFIVPNPTAE